MKWYFASRTRHQESIKILSQFLESQGENAVSDWVYEGVLTPYDQNMEKAQKVARQITDSLQNTEVFVLISDEAGTDMFVELGFCLARKNSNPSIKIYIVGPHAKRSLMQMHPAIVHCPTIQDVFEKERIDCAGITLPDLI